MNKVKYIINLPEITMTGYPDKMSKKAIIKEALEFAFRMSLTDRDLKIMVKESKMRKEK